MINVKIAAGALIALLALFGIQSTDPVGFSLLGVQRIGAGSYVASIEVTNRAIVGAVVHDGNGTAYHDGRAVAEAWLLERDISVPANGKAIFTMRIRLLVPESEVAKMTGVFILTATVRLSILVFRDQSATFSQSIPAEVIVSEVSR